MVLNDAMSHMYFDPVFPHVYRERKDVRVDANCIWNVDANAESALLCFAQANRHIHDRIFC